MIRRRFIIVSLREHHRCHTHLNPDYRVGPLIPLVHEATGNDFGEA
jgi:hypothetical protein